MQSKESLRNSAGWFALLTPEQQNRALLGTTITSYPAGAIVERKGEQAQAWIGVINGLLKVSVGDANGKLASLTGVPSGGWIGEGSLLKREEIGRASRRERVCQYV